MLKNIHKLAFSKDFIPNVFDARHKKNVLISYIIIPFVWVPPWCRTVLRHTNARESMAIAECFNALGYNIDVANFLSRRRFHYSKYDVIFGFGIPFEESFRFPTKPQCKRVYYATGSHVHFQNCAEIQRIRQIRMRKGILLRSQRIVAQTWSMSTGLCDALIVLGNRVTAETYRLFDGLTIYPLDATAFIPSKPFQRSVSSSRKSFLWFGGCGLVHKGLDLCLEYFSQHPELTLHICGLREDDFFQAYQDELSQKNIIYHGCVDVLSDTFRDIAAQCLFTILPSCSEGQATALLTSMATGLIPVASRETGVDIQDRGFLIEFLTPEKVGEAVQRALNTAEPVLENMSETCRRSILASHEISVFRKNFRHIIEVVLNDGKIS